MAGVGYKFIINDDIEPEPQTETASSDNAWQVEQPADTIVEQPIDLLHIEQSAEMQFAMVKKDVEHKHKTSIETVKEITVIPEEEPEHP